MVAFRNVLIHAYGAVEHEVVWTVVESFLPALKAKLDELIREVRLPDG